jgi:hypothetical protein
LSEVGFVEIFGVFWYKEYFLLKKQAKSLHFSHPKSSPPRHSLPITSGYCLLWLKTGCRQRPAIVPKSRDCCEVPFDQGLLFRTGVPFTKKSSEHCLAVDKNRVIAILKTKVIF